MRQQRLTSITRDLTSTNIYKHSTDCQPSARNEQNEVKKKLKIMKNGQNIKGSNSLKNQHIENFTHSDK